MMDLTPLEVRKKNDDFRRQIRGYEPGQVDDFLDLVADRLEQLVKENRTLAESSAKLEQQVGEYREREKALTEALVSAQQMREEMRAQAMRDAEQARSQAATDADRARTEAAEVLAQAKDQAAREIAEATAEATRRLTEATETAERELAEARMTVERELAEARATAERELAEARATAERELADARATAETEVGAARASAEEEARRIIGNARDVREREEALLQDLTARRASLLESYQSLLEREMADLRNARQAAAEARAAAAALANAPVTPAEPGTDAPGALGTPSTALEAHTPALAEEAELRLEEGAAEMPHVAEEEVELLLEEEPAEMPLAAAEEDVELLLEEGPAEIPLAAAEDEVELLLEEESSARPHAEAVAGEASGLDPAAPVSDEEWLESLLEEVGVEPVMGGAVPPAPPAAAGGEGADALREELGLDDDDLGLALPGDEAPEAANAGAPGTADLEADRALEEGSAEFAELLLEDDDADTGVPAEFAAAGDEPGTPNAAAPTGVDTGSDELAALLEQAEAELRAAEAAAGLVDLDDQPDASRTTAEGSEAAGAIAGEDAEHVGETPALAPEEGAVEVVPVAEADGAGDELEDDPDGDDEMGLDAMFSDEDDDLKAFDFDAALVNATGMPAAPANSDPLSFTNLPSTDSLRKTTQSFGFGIVADERNAAPVDGGIFGNGTDPRLPPVPSALPKAQEDESGEAGPAERRPDDDDDMFANLFDGRR